MCRGLSCPWRSRRTREASRWEWGKGGQSRTWWEPTPQRLGGCLQSCCRGWGQAWGPLLRQAGRQSLGLTLVPSGTSRLRLVSCPQTSDSGLYTKDPGARVAFPLLGQALCCLTAPGHLWFWLQGICRGSWHLRPSCLVTLSFRGRPAEAAGTPAQPALSLCPRPREPERVWAGQGGNVCIRAENGSVLTGQSLNPIACVWII